MPAVQVQAVRYISKPGQSRGLIAEEMAERKELFAIVTAARAAVKARRADLATRHDAVFLAEQGKGKGPQEAKTLDNYQRTVDRLLRDTPAETWEAAKRKMNGDLITVPSTWIQYASALSWWSLKYTEHVLSEQGKAQDRGAADPWHPEHRSWKELVRSLNFIAGVLRERPAESPITCKHQRRSKRNSLKGLNANYVMEIYGNISPSRWGLPFLGVAVCGCRPAELAERGLPFVATPTTLQVVIGGAKFTAISGQKERTLTWSIGPDTAPAIIELHRLAMEAGGKLHIKFESDDPDAVPDADKSPFSKAIARAVKRLYPKHKHRVSAYSLRNSYAADIKAAEWLTDQQRSQGLGHISSKTKGYYGAKLTSRGRFSVAPTSITATADVRNKAKSPATLSLEELPAATKAWRAAAKKSKAKKAL